MIAELVENTIFRKKNPSLLTVSLRGRFKSLSWSTPISYFLRKILNVDS